jgi:hypothetical protein
MLRAKPHATIADAFGEGPVIECGGPDCGKLFANLRNLNQQCGHEHVRPIGSNSIRSSQQLY